MLAKHKDEKATVQQGTLMKVADDTAGNIVPTHKCKYHVKNTSFC